MAQQSDVSLITKLLLNFVKLTYHLKKIGSPNQLDPPPLCSTASEIADPHPFVLDKDVLSQQPLSDYFNFSSLFNAFFQ